MPSTKRQDSFEICFPSLPKLDMQKVQRKTKTNSDSESLVSTLSISNPRKESSSSNVFRRSVSCFNEVSGEDKTISNSQFVNPPAIWRLAQLSSPEWLYSLLGSIGAAIFGSLNPLLAFILVQIAEVYLRIHLKHTRCDVDSWCLVITSMGAVTVVANFFGTFLFWYYGGKNDKAHSQNDVFSYIAE